MANRNAALTLLVGLALVACGGGGTAAAPAKPAATKAAAKTPAPAGAKRSAAASPADTAAAADTSSTALARETFAYRGAGRDPFVSLLKSGDVRPLPEDLKVAVINYDPRYPQRSVAVLTDTAEHKRYRVRVGDSVGRIRVREIRAAEVILVIEEFGLERQVVLPIRRRQEDIQ